MLEGARDLLEAAGVTLRQGGRVLFERYDAREEEGEKGGGGAASSTFVFSNLGVAAAGASGSSLESDSEEEHEEAPDEDGDGERRGGRGTPAALEQPARASGKRQRLRGGEAAGATAAAAAAATPADTERPKNPRPFPPPLPGFYSDGGGGRRAFAATGAPTAAAAAAAADVPPRSRGLALPSTSVSVPIFTSLDCEFLQLSAEGARLFDAAADGALGGAPERASLFAFSQLVVVEAAVAAGAGSAPPAAGAARPSEAPAPATRLLEKIDVDVDRIPNASSSANRLREQKGGEAEEEPPAFLTLGGPGWVRVAELLGLAPGAAVRFERDPQTGFVHASRAARWF